MAASFRERSLDACGPSEPPARRAAAGPEPKAGDGCLEGIGRGWCALEREDTPPNPFMFGSVSQLYHRQSERQRQTAPRVPTPEVRGVLPQGLMYLPDRAWRAASRERPRSDGKTGMGDTRGPPAKSGSRGIDRQPAATAARKCRSTRAAGVGDASRSLGAIGEEVQDNEIHASPPL